MPIWRKTEEELGEINVPPPYWAFAWAGGQALARYILDVPESVAGRHVLDIGSGSGLVALAAKLAGAKSAMANDIDPFAVAAARMNAEANGISIETSGADLICDDMDFDEFQPDNVAELTVSSGDSIDVASYDVICLGDTFYEEALAIDALMFADYAQSTGARVLVGDPSRSYFPHDRVTKIASYAVPVTRELEDNEIKNSAVYQWNTAS